MSKKIHYFVASSATVREWIGKYQALGSAFITLKWEKGKALPQAGDPFSIMGFGGNLSFFGWVRSFTISKSDEDGATLNIHLGKRPWQPRVVA